MEPNERVRAVRKHFDLTSEQFGERIGLKRNSVSQIETGKNALTEQTAKLICQVYGVNYDWLKNGSGEMLLPKEEARADKLERWLEGNNEFVKEVFYGLADMPVEWWNQAENMLREIFEHKKDR